MSHGRPAGSTNYPHRLGQETAGTWGIPRLALYSQAPLLISPQAAHVVHVPPATLPGSDAGRHRGHGLVNRPDTGG